jgi:hypothetical protein
MAGTSLARRHDDEPEAGPADAPRADQRPRGPDGHGGIKFDGSLSPFKTLSSDNTIAPIDIHDFHDFDDASMQAYQRRMDTYFSYDRPLYPSRDGYPEVRDRHFRYFRIAETDTERMFPDDADFRRFIDALRHIFATNVVRYTLSKRAALALVLLLLCIAPHVRLGAIAPTVSTATLAAAIVVVFATFTFIWYTRYERSLRQSCSNIKSIVTRRYTDLSVLLPSLQKAIESGDKLHISAGDDHWPRKAAFITKLIIWIAKRMEYQEKYLQPEMWRISRMQYFWRNTGKWIGRGTGLAFVAFEALAFWSNRAGLDPGAAGSLEPAQTDFQMLPHAVILLAGIACYLLSRTERFNLDKEYVQDILRKDVRRVSGSRIDEIIGELVENDKAYAIGMFHRDHPMPRDHSGDRRGR